MSGIPKVIYNIVRGVTRLCLLFILMICQAVIYLVTFEPGTKDRLTVRKAKRIRLLSRLKVWFLNVLPEPVSKFIGVEDYKIYLNQHLKNGLQLRYSGANK